MTKRHTHVTNFFYHEVIMMKYCLQKRLLLVTLIGLGFSQFGHAQLANRQSRTSQSMAQYDTSYTYQTMKGSPQQTSKRTSRSSSQQKNSRNKD